jgi:molybdopterin synthase catalytic subunit
MSCDADIIKLQGAPLDVSGAIEGVGVGDSGAIAVFLGITRRDSDSLERELVALDYEAYLEMAENQMRGLVEDARRRWQIGRAVLLHRTGIVKVGEPSVLVVVSTPHRAEAFEACRFLIDQLKAQATIWKKEVWADGSTSWVDGQGK